MSRPPQTNESVVHTVEMIISHLLRLGVAISVLLIVTGTILSFVHHPGYLASAKDLPLLTNPGEALPRSAGETLQGLQAGRGQAWVMLGLLVLIATPVMRVAVSIFAFLYQRDWVFTTITAVVLIMLLLAFYLGKAG